MNKTETIVVHADADLKARVEAAAEAAGLGLSSYVRSILLRLHPAPLPPVQV